MSIHDKRRVAIAVVAVACTVSGLAATTASAATWTGTAEGKIQRSSRLVSGGTSWHGTLSFTTDRAGVVRGHAVVAYEPFVDVSGLTNAIGYVKTVGSTAVGLLGPFGAAASGAVLGQIVGAGVSFRSTLAIRRGPLTGRWTGRKLKLRWNEKLPGIPYDITFVLASGTEKIGKGQASLRNPFGEAGDVTGRTAVHASEPKPTRGDGVTQLLGSYWVATRVD